jgi:beta-glucosidase
VGRPYVLTDVAAVADALLIAYRPGVSQGAEAIAKALYGEQNIDGVLPFQLPSSMASVLEQREDLPGDLQSPLFDYGYGLHLESTTQEAGDQEE